MLDEGLLFQRSFHASQEVIFYTDAAGVILEVNEAFTRIYGYAREDVIGKNPRILSSGLTSPSVWQEAWTEILDPQVNFWKGEVINRTKDGVLIPVLITISAVRAESGEILAFIANCTDISNLFENHLSKQIPTRVEEVLLVSDSGLLISHARRDGREVSPLVLAGMMRAMVTFMGDALHTKDYHPMIEELEFGKVRMVIEPIGSVMLCVIISGPSRSSMRLHIREFLETLWLSHRDLIEAWDGNDDLTASLAPFLDRLVDLSVT